MMGWLVPSWLKRAAVGTATFIVAVFTALMVGRVSGAKKEKTKVKLQAAKDYVDTTERMQSVGNENLSDDDVLDRLRKLGGQ